MRASSARETRIAIAATIHDLPLDAFPEAHIHRFDQATLDPTKLPTDLALVIVDGDLRSIALVREACKDPRLSSVPRLLLARDPTFVADDVVHRPITARREELVRRLSLLLDLGSMRVALRQQDLEQRAFDNAVLDGVDLGIVTTDPRGRVTYSNRAARGLLSVDCLDDADINEVLSLGRSLSSMASEGTSRTIADREIDVRVSEYEGDFVLVLRDATEEHKMQLEMRRVERLAAIGTMVSGFAHEVRNPVASLRSMAESLEEDLADAGMKLPHVSRMLSVLARIERLVSTSLQFGKPASPRPTSVQPWTLVSTALTTVGARTSKLGSDLRVEIDPELANVFVDEGQLVQVLVILLNNAIDATQDPRNVILRATTPPLASQRGKSRPPPGTVRFEVEDDGPGIPRDVEAHIFDPFFTTKATGTGLGLSIAQQIVSENGARISLESARDPTLFVVECPTYDHRPRRSILRSER